MLVRALLLVCLLSQTARADNTAVTAPAATPATTNEAKAAAVPVDKEALVAPTEESTVVHRDLEDDPLFVPAAVLIGGGSAALLASLFTGLGADSMYRSLERDCPNDVCTPNRQSRIDSGKSLAVVSTVLTGVGVLAAAAGTVLMVIAATRDGEKQPELGNFQLSLTGGPTPLGIGATARF